VGGDSNITITNKSFDFSTYRQVKLLSTTVKKFTKYDVFAYTADPYFAESNLLEL
jgi:hypothetical protein